MTEEEEIVFKAKLYLEGLECLVEEGSIEQAKKFYDDISEDFE